MSPLGLLDLWHFLFLFTYVSPGFTRPVALYVNRNKKGLIIPGEKYVNRNKKCHRSNNPRGDICK
jgi:hypothetical protein